MTALPTKPLKGLKRDWKDKNQIINNCLLSSYSDFFVVMLLFLTFVKYCMLNAYHISPSPIYIFMLHRAYSADIKTEPVMDYNNDQEELPHTFSPKFNPYRQSRYNTHTPTHTPNLYMKCLNLNCTAVDIMFWKGLKKLFCKRQ